MKNVELYIADTRVDLDSESLITMTYTLEDTDNPTIVKNSFSKSISLPATETNNALFGHIYDLSRETIISEGNNKGVNFNTLKRTPFSIYREGELVESGYIQLTAIIKANGTIRYSVQAYGGLGDFLYNLMYTEDGEKRNLASLDYGVDMDFVINREIINNAWTHLPRSGRNTLEETITFVPAYNGVSSDFDAKHAVLNYHGINALNIPRTATDSGKEYVALNGYAGVEFNRAMDEPEVRDMRSYLQRPALSVERLVSACCNPINNGGYNVILDPTFFNEGNALYYDAYITLPMMSCEIDKTESTTKLRGSDGYIGGATNVYVRDITVGAMALKDMPTNANIKVNIPLSVAIDSAESELFTDVALYRSSRGKDFKEGAILSAIVAQVIVRDYSNSNVLAVSNEVALSQQGEFSRQWKIYEKYDNVDRGIVNIKGHFEQRDGMLQFISTDNMNTFPIEASFVKGDVTNILVTLRVQRAYYKDYSKGNVHDDLPVITMTASTLWKRGSSYVDTGKQHNLDSFATTGNVIGCYREGSEVIMSIANLPSISSGTNITKNILLGSTESPADYLLSYCKLFGLRFIKDTLSKEIHITSRYFNGNVMDIEDRIDRSQEVSIAPNVFSKKYMRMALDQPETYFAKKYKNSNKLEYGQKRVDTGFAFNNETEEIYSSNVYTTAVPCLAVSKFFYTFKNADGVETFAAIADNPKLLLTNGNATSGYNTHTVDLLSSRYIDVTKSIPLSSNKGYDLMPRMCYFDEKDGVREAVDISNNLVIFCRNVELKNKDGEEVAYWVTDDVPEMMTLCGANCYLLTMDESDTLGNSIATKRTSLPLFLSMRLMKSDITHSFDFAKSKESYIPGITYHDRVTLYERYWSDYYRDRMDVDTRVVTAYVDLSGIVVNGEILRNFYYFDGCYWLLNKVEDFDITSDRMTKCEFIKVKDRSAYYKPIDRDNE